MSLLRESIRKQLLIEKTIAQILSNLEVTFNLEVDRTHHAFLRKTRKGLDDYNQREISNPEIKEVLDLAKKEIVEKIVTREINDETDFVVKSLKWELAIAVVALFQGGTYWILKVTTVFRESIDNPFRTGKDQIVIWV